MAAIRMLVMLFAAIIPLVALVEASPRVNFPFNLQFPSIARVGEAYSFQLASTTFQPDPDKLEYSLIGNPSWLHINSNNRTLWGTPGAEDAGTATFTITAAGEAGAVVNMESKLLVESDDSPKTSGNISQPLSKAGQLSGPKTVTLMPSKPFEIEFPRELFQAEGKNLTYHATLAVHTPLPAWISFDAQSLRFAGTTPSSDTPQSFDILLIASDAPGYTAASMPFTIAVSNHQLQFRPLTQTMNMSKGETIKITGLKGTLFLDDSPARDEDIQSAKAELPSWLSFDDRTFEINGTPPSGLMSQDLSITVQDKFGDFASHAIYVMFTSQLFNGEVGALNISAGEYYEHFIPKSILANGSGTVSVDFGALSEWLSFDTAALKIHGTVPGNFPPRQIEASLSASSSDGMSKDTQSFQLRVLDAGTLANSGDVPMNPSTNKPGKSDDPLSKHTISSKAKRAGVIAGSVLSALFAAIILLAFMFFLCRRKKHNNDHASPKTPRSPRKADISHPKPFIHNWEDMDGTYEVDLEKGKFDSTPERPPQINFDIAGKREDSHSPTCSIAEPEQEILTAFKRSSYGYLDETGKSHRPHDSMKIPTMMSRGESASSRPEDERRIAPVHIEPPRRSFELPARQLSGAGNGLQAYSPSRSSRNFSTFRRHFSSSSCTTGTRTMSMLSTARHTTQLTIPLEKRHSIRPIPASSTCESLLDRRTLDEKRKSYIRKRASAQTEAPFFAAASSRISSSSYKIPPAFIGDSSPTMDGVLPLLSTNTIKPSDDNVKAESKERELPESLRIRKPADTPSPVTENGRYPGSLRKNRAAFLRRYTATTSAASNRDGVEEPVDRSGTTTYSRTAVGRRASSRHSLRAAEIKSDLNSLTESRVFEDAEMSGSAYSSEEEVIEEYERRNTVKPNQFTLPPLNLNLGKNRRASKQESKRDSKSDDKRDSHRVSKRGSKRELKRTSQRDPTPYSRALEHGGKENHSSTYSLPKLTAVTTTNVSSSTKGKAKATTPLDCPKTAVGIRPTSRHSVTHSRTTNRSSTARRSAGRPLSRIDSTKERHSRKSIHSRQQSRGSGSARRKQRDRSRTQSSAFPHFDASILAQGSQEKDAIDTAKTKSKRDVHASTLQRDRSGNIVNYAAHESPKIEELTRNSIGLPASKGRVSSSARHSKLAQLHTSPFYHSKRDTAIPSSATPSSSVGLGLSLGDSLAPTEETSATVGRRRIRERTPLSVLSDGNGASPNLARLVEGKGKRPVSVEMDGDDCGAGERGSRWGSLRGVLGRSAVTSSLWGARDAKAFL